MVWRIIKINIKSFYKKIKLQNCAITILIFHDLKRSTKNKWRSTRWLIKKNNFNFKIIVPNKIGNNSNLLGALFWSCESNTFTMR